MTTLVLYVDDVPVTLQAHSSLIDDTGEFPRIDPELFEEFNQELRDLDIPIELIGRSGFDVAIPPEFASDLPGLPSVGDEMGVDPIGFLISARRLNHPTKTPKKVAMYFRPIGSDISFNPWGSSDNSTIRNQDMNLPFRIGYVNRASPACIIDLDAPEIGWLVEMMPEPPPGFLGLDSARLLTYPIAKTIDVSEVVEELVEHPIEYVGRAGSYDPRYPVEVIRLINRAENPRTVFTKGESDLSGYALTLVNSNSSQNIGRMVDADQPLEIDAPLAPSSSQFGRPYLTIPPNKDVYIFPSYCATSNPPLQFPTPENPIISSMFLGFHTWKAASTFYRVPNVEGSSSVAVGQFAMSMNPTTNANEYGFFLIFPKNVSGKTVIYDVNMPQTSYSVDYFHLDKILMQYFEGEADVANASNNFVDAHVIDRKSGRSGCLITVPDGHSAIAYLPWKERNNYTMSISPYTSIQQHLMMGMVDGFTGDVADPGTFGSAVAANLSTAVEFVKPWPSKENLFPNANSAGLAVDYAMAIIAFSGGDYVLRSRAYRTTEVQIKYRLRVFAEKELNDYLLNLVDVEPVPIIDVLIDSDNQAPVGYTQTFEEMLTHNAQIPITIGDQYVDQTMVVLVSSNSASLFQYRVSLSAMKGVIP